VTATHEQGPVGTVAEEQALDRTVVKVIIFSTRHPAPVAQRTRRSGGFGWLDYLGPPQLSPTLWPDHRARSPFGLAHTPRLLTSARKAIFRQPLSMNRQQLLQLRGWSFAEGLELESFTATTLVLENMATHRCWYGILPQRNARSDVAARYHSMPDSSTRFSGFNAYADIGDLPPGTYRIGMEYQKGQQSILFMFHPRVCVV
ncbi:MAG: hypothetical protein WCJ21_09145, partial [Planctomycetota bacterium]